MPAPASYDSAIANWFAKQQGDTFPERLTIAAERVQTLRYGENPHQQAAFYSDGSKRPGIATARMVQGKELSYNNIGDTEAAYECVAEFNEPAVVVVKHANPCGVAIGKDQYSAYLKAYACDPVSIYGGIVARQHARSRPATATDLAKRFLEVVIAPDATPEALAILASEEGRARAAGRHPARSVERRHDVEERGRRLSAAEPRQRPREESDLKVVTKRAPTAKELDDLLFAFTVCKHVKSNAIVYAKDGATVGVGAGQMNRRDSSRIAAIRAAEAGELAGLKESPAIGSVVASDAFFPFADGLLGRGRSRRHRRHPARRLDARQGSDRGRRQGRPRHGLHRHAALPALIGPVQAAKAGDDPSDDGLASIDACPCNRLSFSWPCPYPCAYESFFFCPTETNKGRPG